MRYLNTFIISLPAGVIITVWAVQQMLLTSALLLLGLGACGGFVLSPFMIRSCRRKLFLGQSDVLARRVPGGIWFFILLGIGGAVVLSFVHFAWGRAAVYGVVIVFTAAFVALFSTLGVWVIAIEQQYKKKVFMWPKGLFFEE